MAKQRPNFPGQGFSPELETQIFLPGSKGLELDSGANTLVIDQGIEYPNRGDLSGSYLVNLLLDETPGPNHNGVRKLILPNNFITFAQVFNDALSVWTEHDAESRKLAYKNLHSIGAKLGAVIDQDRVKPVELTYKNILLVRDTSEVKLLPPISFESAHDTEAAKDIVVDDFLTSCLEGATTGPQLQQFNEVIHGFTDGIEGRQ